MKIKLDQFFDTKSLLKAVELTEYIAHDGIFDVKDTGITYKTVNHWDSQNLLVTRRKAEAKWRKFSFIDYIWLKIVEQFRTIGTSIPLLLRIKEEIMEEIRLENFYNLFQQNPGLINKLPDGNEKEELKALLSSGVPTGPGVSLLQILVCETIMNKEPLSLIVFSDGYWFPWYLNRPELYDEEERHRMSYHTQTIVSLTEIVKDFLADERSMYVLPNLHLLSSKEAKLLEMVHSGEYESITVKFKSRKMKSLELVKAQHVKRKIVDILAENDYQELIIKSHQGMVSTIKNTIKVIL